MFLRGSLITTALLLTACSSTPTKKGEETMRDSYRLTVQYTGVKGPQPVNIQQKYGTFNKTFTMANGAFISDLKGVYVVSMNSGKVSKEVDLTNSDQTVELQIK